MKKTKSRNSSNRYLINGKEYQLKEKYSSKDWGQIIVVLSAMQETKVVMGAVGQLLASGDFEKMLNIILDVNGKPIEELYEESFDNAGRAFNDFFELKKSSIGSIAGSSKK